MDTSFIRIVEAIAFFFLVLFGVIFVRGKLKKIGGEDYALDNTVIGLALVPVLLLLLGTGSLKSLDLFGVKVETAEKAIDRATSAPVGPQVTKVNGDDTFIEKIAMGAKMGIGVIPDFVRKRIPALSLQLGERGYQPDAVAQYLAALTRYPFFHYLVIVDKDKQFVGIAEVPRFTQGTPYDPSLINLNALVEALSNSEADRLGEILPGFIPAREALEKDVDKRTALKRMDELAVSYLPVVDGDRMFIGVVDRSRLTASILVDVAQRLDLTR
jgi:CBS domain-containing protein